MEEEVMGRLATGEKAGLTGDEAARRLRVYGPNIVVRSHDVRTNALLCFFLFLSYLHYTNFSLASNFWLQFSASPN